MNKFKAGEKKNQGFYRSFQPNLINRQWFLNDPELQILLSEADRLLGQLDMFSHYVPNIELFIRMHIIKEATQSGKIEGTQTNIEEALLDQEDVTIEKRDDWQEVQNYINALHLGIAGLNDVPLSSRLIKEVHYSLLQGVRGEQKLPGEFRTSQNWIGGASINDAVFIPPHFETISDLMSDLEKFIHNQSIHVPDLIKIAIIHYQFETIHPFLDGNGRIGRLLIILYLIEKKLIQKPILYISNFFENNRQLYYDNLMNCREKDNLRQWLRFFLNGIAITARQSIQTFNAILDLKQRTEVKIANLGSRFSNAQLVLDALFKSPLINAIQIAKLLSSTPNTAYKLITDFENLGILTEITGYKRKRLYRFDEYIRLFD